MSLNTTPPSYASGQVVTPSNLNALQDGIQASGTIFTPGWTAITTNPVLGNGTKTGRYRQVGKWFDVEISIQMGTTTTFGSGAWLLDLPATQLSSQLTPVLSSVICTDVSTGLRWQRGAFTQAAPQVLLGDSSGVLISSTSPFAWAASDYLLAFIRYEAA